MDFPCPDAVRHARSGVGDDTHEPPMGKKGEGRAEEEEKARVTAVTVIGRYWGQEGAHTWPWLKIGLRLEKRRSPPGQSP